MPYPDPEDEEALEELARNFYYEKIRFAGRFVVIPGGSESLPYLLTTMYRGSTRSQFLELSRDNAHPAHAAIIQNETAAAEEAGTTFKEDITTQAGWKFHISLADNDQENIARGWNIVVKILIKHQAQSAKVIEPDYIMENHDKNERGKQITIYASRQRKPVEEWRDLLQSITTALATSESDPDIDHHQKPIVRYKEATMSHIETIKIQMVNTLVKKD